MPLNIAILYLLHLEKLSASCGFMVRGLCKLGVNCLNDVGSVNQNRNNTEPDSKHFTEYIL
ncbi:hypothetical protein, partial [Desulfonatronospira sp.]|uniref:hypothetical protein n=1 Tax=Desulfonatronospira sp. TaxID=1962951 RepID=UPI0025BAA14D